MLCLLIESVRFIEVFVLHALDSIFLDSSTSRIPVVSKIWIRRVEV